MVDRSRRSEKQQWAALFGLRKERVRTWELKFQRNGELARIQRGDPAIKIPDAPDGSRIHRVGERPPSPPAVPDGFEEKKRKQPLKRKAPVLPSTGVSANKPTGSNKWNELMKRIAKVMVGHVNKKQWADFLGAAARAHHVAFLRAYQPPGGLITCIGKVDGSPCPYHRTLKLPGSFENMQLDHQPSFATTISLWQDAIKFAKSRKIGSVWYGTTRFGTKFGEEILHRLCSVTANEARGWPPALRWRCSDLSAPALAQVHWCHPASHEQARIDRRPRPGWSTAVPELQ